MISRPNGMEPETVPSGNMEVLDMAKRKATVSPTLTVEQAGHELGISRNSAYEAAKRGDIPTIRIGRRILVPRVALERMLIGAWIEGKISDKFGRSDGRETKAA